MNTHIFDEPEMGIQLSQQSVRHKLIAEGITLQNMSQRQTTMPLIMAAVIRFSFSISLLALLIRQAHAQQQQTVIEACDDFKNLANMDRSNFGFNPPAMANNYNILYGHITGSNDCRDHYGGLCYRKGSARPDQKDR